MCNKKYEEYLRRCDDDGLIYNHTSGFWSSEKEKERRRRTMTFFIFPFPSSSYLFRATPLWYYYIIINKKK